MSRGLLAGVLVGGASRRMGGEPKGLLLGADGVPILERTVNLAREVSGEVVLVGRADAYAAFGVPAIADANAEGPLAGLVALLEHARDRNVIALACDMPYVTRAMIERLATFAPEAAAVAARETDGASAPRGAARSTPGAVPTWSPLFARYDASRVAPVARAKLDAGERSLRAVLDAVDARELPLSPDERRALRDWDHPGDIDVHSREAMTTMRIYDFEHIASTLDLVPLSARRALDAAGMRVSLEAWQASPLDLRRTIATLGSQRHVDGHAVREALEKAEVPSFEVQIPDEPAIDEPPAELASVVTKTAWPALSPLDRYALWKVARGKHPGEVLPHACAEIAPLSTHVSGRGEAHMVDVGAKAVTARRAAARARVIMEKATADRLRAGDVAKGDVLATARIAGIQAAKRTSDLIPLCHLIALTRVTVDFTVEADGVSIDAAAEAHDRTGVEMEALTAASVAALTVYDMLKSVDRGMRITVELMEKSGGKTGTWARGTV